MEGLFTRNYESCADAICPKLAKVDAAAAVFFWLHSRAFANGNRIKISQKLLAEILGVDRKTVGRVVKRLKDAGLITAKARRGDRGTTVFSLANEAITPQPCTAYAPFQWDTSIPSDGADTSHYKDKDPVNEERDISADWDAVEDVIAHLNMRAGKGFRTRSESHGRLVMGLLQDGYTVQDMKRVIDLKCDEWKGTDYERYLRPETLFSPNHFDTYLNQETHNTSRKEASHDGQQRRHAELDDYEGRF